jgi:hypothetical protein
MVLSLSNSIIPAKILIILMLFGNSSYLNHNRGSKTIEFDFEGVEKVAK